MLMQQWYKVETPDAQKNFNNPVGGFAFYNNFKLLFLGVLLEVDSWLITTGDDEANRNEEAAWSVHFNLRKDFLNDRLSLTRYRSVQFKFCLEYFLKQHSTMYSVNRIAAVSV